MGKKILVIVLGLLLIYPLSLRGKEKRGADLVIQKKDGQKISGELITVKQDSLLLLSEEGADISVCLDDIRVITVVKKSKALNGLAQGATYGAIAGLIGYVAISSAESDDYFGPGGMGILAPIVFIPLGALLGTIIGAASSADKTIQIEGESKAEIKETLEYLRKKARIPDYN